MPEDHIEELINAMTLDEKASLSAGTDNWHTAAIERLGVPAVKMTDGPNGARGGTNEQRRSVTPSVCIPTGSALGATWDMEMVALASAAVARQAKQKSAAILLAPTVNLHRHPLWGRNFEAFSEDPYLTGRLAVAYIKAVQGEGVAATIKHLVANETEHERRMSSSQVDERTLRELYLLPFEMAVQESGVLALMTSYNRLNGRYVADDARLLTDVLRGEWGYQGLVMTDWWALASTADAARAGLDIEMPGPGRSFGLALAQAVRSGEVPEHYVDAIARRVLGVWDRLGVIGRQSQDVEEPLDDPADRAMARRVATDAMVLLVNEGVLPLDTAQLRHVALVGPGAARLAVMGGGSARVRTHYELSLAEVLRARLGEAATVSVEAGCQLTTAADDAPWSSEDEDAAISRAVELASSADATIVVVGTNDFWESEGYDRTSMDLPGRQAQLVGRVLEVSPSAVVVLNTGSPVTLPFADRARALLQCWFGGQELANALVDVLFGDAEPGGRLPVTMPQRLEHTPAFGNFPTESSSIRYGEGQLIGYRWYQARYLPVRFPFGHGLSYTTTVIGPVRASTTELAPGGTLTLEVDVENTGARAGAEVVQVYVAPPGGGDLRPGGRLRPVKALKGFAKVRLAPGEKQTVTIELNERSFAYYDIADKDWPEIIERLSGTDPDSSLGLHRDRDGWYLDGGTYEVQVGRSCEDISETVLVTVPQGDGPLPAGSPAG